jgi:phage baseplate assembly protein gpV
MADGTVSVEAGTKVTVKAPDVEIDGDLKVTGDIVAAGDIKDQGGLKSMQGMRATYNSHKHGGSSTPDAGM